jgi:PAS domain S-box-containing protein
LPDEFSSRSLHRRVPDEKLALAFHTSPNGFAITTLEEGRYLECNDSECRLTGYRRDELIGRTSLDLGFWVDPGERQALRRLLDEERLVYNFDFRCCRKSGDIRFGLFSAALITFDGQRCMIGEIVDITEKKEAEEALRRTREKLEERVVQRTRQLEELNESLRREIAERLRTEKALKRRERDLKRKTTELEDTNTALKVLLKKTSQDQLLHEEKVIYNVRELVMPHLEKLKRSELPGHSMLVVNALESALADLISPFMKNLTVTYHNLTPSELQIANFIRQGSSSKDIARLMALSSRTVESHRKNIRRKLGIQNFKTNLRTYLQGLENSLPRNDRI